MNTKSNNDADQRLDRIIAAVKAANVPDYVISGMLSRMPKGTWQVQQGGEKPSRELFAIAGLFTKNVAGAEGAWHAMMLRKGGASLSEVAYGFSCAAAHNHNNIGLSQGTDGRPGPGYFFRATLGKSRWSMVFTAKGEKAIMQKLAALSTVVATASAKPAKAVAVAKGKAKAKKATKVAPTPKPTVDQPTVTVTPSENQTVESSFETEGFMHNPVHEIDQPTVDTTITYSRENDGSVTETVTPTDLTALADHFNS